MRLFLTLFLMAAATLLGNANGTNPQTLRVELLGCKIQPGNALRLQIRDLSTYNAVLVRTLVSVTEKRQLAAADLPPGSYVIDIGWPDNGHGYCGAVNYITMLNGRVRQIALLGRSASVLSDDTRSIAGTLPISGLRASLRYAVPNQAKDCCIVDAMVDGQAYYIDGVPSGHAFLRIYGPRYRWVEFDVGVIGATRSTRGVVFNVSKEMLNQALSHIEGV